MSSKSQFVTRATIAICLVATLSCATGPASAADAPKAQAKHILDAAGVKGGLVVHVGCGDGRLTAALRAGESYLVHGLDTDAANAAAARENIRKLGVYGKVSADRFAGRSLPYIANSVNLVVAENLGAVPMAEVMRVLCPNGVAYVKSSGTWSKSVKPRPGQIDDWTHYLYDATNNAVSHDTAIGPPRRLQWVGSPRWARHHDHMASLSALVSAGGRIFYIFDEGPTAAIQLPPKWTLVARDAFNGTVLWRRRIEKWHPHLWPLKSGPALLPRRLVAVGQTVYVTLGIDAPVTALDAATGKTLRTYEGSKGTEEILAADGNLFLLGPQTGDRKDTRSRYPTLESLRTAAETNAWFRSPRAIRAVRAETGKLLWQASRPVLPMTLTVGAAGAWFHDGQSIVCLDRSTGKEKWSSAPVARAGAIPPWFAPTLLVRRNVVLFAGAENMVRHRGAKDKLTALSAETGKVLWSAPHPPSGYDSPEDVFVTGDLVWSAPTTNRRDTGEFVGRDLTTGEVKRRFPADDGNHMPHHRCHRAKATDKYLLMSRTGIELVDTETKHWDRNDWVRGSCLYGIMPANGLIYAPPHSCGCYIVAKLNGFSALAPAEASTSSDRPPGGARLEKGPAYGKVDAGQSEADAGEAWPTYRGNPARTGRTGTAVPAELKQAWQTQVGGTEGAKKLSSVVVAEGKLFVASVEDHTVHALDMRSGKPSWRFTAGGRVDSPPTIWRGRAIFGSADGWVYCVRTIDGALAWRFRAAPHDRRLVSLEQVESPWPVHGSVLVRQGVVHCVAGRSMFLDGGMRYLRLDAKAGKKLSETVMDSRHPQTGKQLDANIKWPSLPVALPDVLSCDTQYVYMRSQQFNFDGRRIDVKPPTTATDQKGPGAHLFCTTGFLDDTWWHRSYWLWGKNPMSGAGGWYRAAYNAPAGRIMVADESRVYAFGRKPQYFPRTTALEYQLFCASKSPEIVKLTPAAGKPAARRGKAPAPKRKRTRGPASHAKYTWSRDVPLLGRALALADKTLFVAGPPDLVDQEASLKQYGRPAAEAKLAAETAALAGRKGGLLWAVSAVDGKRLAQYALDSPPVFDGMAAAGGRLYIATLDGKVLCYSQK